MAISTISYGRTFTDQPEPTTVMGMPGWWTVPRQWYARQAGDGRQQWEVSPNSDFDPLYIAELADDGITRCFQNLLWNREYDNDR